MNPPSIPRAHPHASRTPGARRQINGAISQSCCGHRREIAPLICRRKERILLFLKKNKQKLFVPWRARRRNAKNL